VSDVSFNISLDNNSSYHNIYESEIPSPNKTFEIRICAYLAVMLFPESFKCSLNVPVNRNYQCLGANTQVPSIYWGTGINGTLNFLGDDTGGKPPFFENSPGITYKIVVRSPLKISLKIALILILDTCRLIIPTRIVTVVPQQHIVSVQTA